MTRAIFIALPGNDAMAAALAARTGGAVAALETRAFPDGETYLRLHGDVGGKSVAIVCSLDRPDGKFLPLAFTAAMARDLGAGRVGLVAPYLAYMRQDRRFKSGEAVTSGSFARLLSSSVDWLVTVDPHLHRHASLDEIYDDPYIFKGTIYNYMVKVLSMAVTEIRLGVWTSVSCDDARLERAQHNLEHRVELFGVQEDFDRFCAHLSERFGWDLGAVANVNRSTPVEASDALRQRIARDNALDVELYRFAKELLHRRELAAT